MKCKWYFRNDSHNILSEVSTNKPKSTWNPPKESPVLGLLLNNVNEDIFSILPGHHKKINFE